MTQSGSSDDPTPPTEGRSRTQLNEAGLDQAFIYVIYRSHLDYAALLTKPFYDY